MKSTDPLVAVTLGVVDAMIADAGARWVPGPHADALVEWSRAATASEDTSKELDAKIAEAFVAFVLDNANY